MLRARASAATDALRVLITADDAALTPVVYQEILQGAASPERLNTLSAYFRTLPFLLPRHPIETYAAAAELYVRCRQLGITPRSPHDCLVARIAVEHHVALLHDDRDYELLARAEPGLRFHLP